MGTFHQGMSELHGITVVVETKGTVVYVGRCHDLEADRMILVDADRHADGDEGLSKDEFVRRAARVGVWGREARVAIPTSEIASIRRLGEVPVE